MKLLTKDIEKKLKAQYKKHSDTSYNKSEPVVVKYFAPWGRATWWILEGTPIESHPNTSKVLLTDNDGRTIPDWYLYGLCDLGQGVREFGDVLLSQLLSVTGPMGLRIERDKHYSGTFSNLKEIAGSY
tara:strand:+ start:2759 stop:3142 length:384 start_codon:yes stop_codon:yes gene_type:complete